MNLIFKLVRLLKRLLMGYYSSNPVFIHPTTIFSQAEPLPEDLMSEKRTAAFVHPTAICDLTNGLIELEHNSKVYEYVIFRAGKGSKIKLGAFSSISPFSIIQSSCVGGGISIGKAVMIGPHCMVCDSNHDFKQLEVEMAFAGGVSKGPVIIEDGVWFGAHCTVTSGVTVGHDAVVAANSVVTKNVAPYDIVAGVPANVIGNRKNQAGKTPE